MAKQKIIDWQSLNLPNYEDDAATRARLKAISEELLAAKGLSGEPESNSPGFEPTEAQARQVSVMSCLGLQPIDIALILNIELSMLKLYYTKELTVSANIANMVVAKKALEMAASGKSPDMTKFWLKAKAGWKETAVTELTGKDGKPIELTTAKDRLRKLVQQTSGKATPDE